MVKRTPYTRIKRRVKAVKEYDQSNLDYLKTPLMRTIERRYNRPIQDLLRRGRGEYLAIRLGVTVSCISRWRRLFRIKVKQGRPRGPGRYPQKPINNNHDAQA